MNNAIEIKNLSKEFSIGKRYRDILFNPFSKPKKIKVLSDINLNIKKGEIFGVLGENGAGKTTLLKIIATLILPTSGKVFVNGLDVERNPGEAKKDLGFVVSEERSFYWRLTGRQNLEFFAILNNIDKKHIKHIVDKNLELVGLLKDADRPFRDYSSGMKQKLCVARGLLADPDIIIMDEPTKGIDALSANHIRTFVKEGLVKKKNKTVVWATNNVYEVENFSETIAILHKGSVLAVGIIDELRQKLNVPVQASIEEMFIKAIG